MKPEGLMSPIPLPLFRFGLCSNATLLLQPRNETKLTTVDFSEGKQAYAAVWMDGFNNLVQCKSEMTHDVERLEKIYE